MDKKFVRLALANLHNRHGRNVSKLFAPDVIEQLLLAEAALIVLAQAGEKYKPAQDLIRLCINDPSETEDES